MVAEESKTERENSIAGKLSKEEQEKIIMDITDKIKNKYHL